MPRHWSDFNAAVIEEFRTNGGRVERFGDLPLVVVHTRRDDHIRPVPLIPVFENGDTHLFATNAGSPDHPTWSHDLVARPDVDVEHAIGGEIVTTPVTAHLLGDEEASALLAARAATTPQLAEYLASAAPRRIPVFRLEPSIAPPPTG